jgi:hypothetical protein
LGEVPRERASRRPDFLEGRLGPVYESPTIQTGPSNFTEPDFGVSLRSLWQPEWANNVL